MSTVKTQELPGNRHNSTALANRLQIKASNGQFLSLVGFNSGPDQYIQLHESVASPSDAHAPILVFKVEADSAFSLDTNFNFTPGLWVCNSTSIATLTAGAADCWFLANEI